MTTLTGMSTLPTASVFGVRFHVITVCDLIGFAVKACSGSEVCIIGNVNVRALNLAYEVPWFKDFINRSQLVFCDGIGVVLGARLLGQNVAAQNRMTCPDYLEALAERCAEEGRTLFLLAGRLGIAEKAAKMLLDKHPNLTIGHHHGYFEKQGPQNETVLGILEKFKPDILYVGFGMPIQEKWILDNYDRLHSKVIMPLGACLDFYTGELYRGPRWMTDYGLEWLGRLFTESPKRVWGRYIIGNPLFLVRVIREKFIGR